MQAVKTSISDLVLITPNQHSDERGYFSETFREDWFRAHVADIDFVQDNHSKSLKTGTLRGMHFQTPPREQAKLVRCVAGKILDVAVDIRGSSPTYGQWVSALLSAENANQLYIPAGFAHGFVTLEDNSEITYKVSDYYDKECDSGLAWDDKKMAIDWPNFAEAPILSEKDMELPNMADFETPFP